MTDTPETTPKGDEEKVEMVSKADLDAATAKLDQTEKDLEDVRMEVLTPDYQNFLDAKEKPEAEVEPEAKPVVPVENDIEKMTNQQILDLAVKTAEANIRGTLSKDKEDSLKLDADKTAREIKLFATEHEDYEIFRPIMYGLSLNPKHTDDTLSQLYEAAKAHVKTIHAEPSEEKKDASRRSTSEKPGGDSSSIEELKNMSNEDIAKEALAEVKEAGGTFEV